jgi:4-carboxymuconolactone decarboxylase
MFLLCGGLFFQPSTVALKDVWPTPTFSTIVAGQRPADLTHDEAVAYDVASSLVSGGVLPELCYKQAITAFGEEGTAEFIYLVGLYCMVSVTLNGFDVPVPEEEA